MNAQDWYHLLKSQITALLSDDSTASLAEVVDALVENRDLVVGATIPSKAVLLLILAGAMGTGELDELVDKLAFCCTGETGFDVGIIESVSGRGPLR
ncbi:MAG TPA: hypothetical protein D7I05_04840 [Candidatus Poseidoniales archaeon]|nr:MAG TPA: hypothetical protein D7I05_04840 [Candidatus Poseidoniales archaeon]|tara:strand:- start:331 stop:621 length:291 start_codon:yes stop_codon:yes gene_type:complete